jgi:hypothetical protein
MTIILNVLLFQIGWFACVLGAASGRPWVGAVAAAGIVAWHLARAMHPARELALIAIAIVAGAVFETLLLRSGWVKFETGVLFEGTAAYWMVALWAIFATTINVSLRALRSHLGLAALLGAVGGPVAYYAGTKLGAMEFTAAGLALAAIGLGWVILSPVLFGIARRFDGYARP